MCFKKFERLLVEPILVPADVWSSLQSNVHGPINTATQKRFGYFLKVVLVVCLLKGLLSLDN
jgi:hypothetical protein